MLLPSPEDDYSEFKNPISGIVNPQLQGLIDIETGSGSGFRYSKVVMANLPNITTVIRDDWLIEIQQAIDDPTVLFRQRVKFPLLVQAVPGIFIARPGDDADPNIPEDQQPNKIWIETTILNGVEIDPKTAKDNLDLGFTSEFSITSDFTANEGVGGGEVIGTWQSLPYLQETTEGNVFVIIRDGWRLTGTFSGKGKIATYKTSVKPSVPGFGSFLSHAGGLHLAATKSNILTVTRSYDYGNTIERLCRLQGYTEPSIYQDKTDRIWLGARQGNVYKLLFSLDGGQRFKPVTTMDEKDQAVDVVIWDSKSWKYPFPFLASTGIHYSCAVKDAFVWVKESPDGVTWSQAYRAAAAKRNEPYRLLERKESGALVLTNSSDHVLQSTDGGRTFTQV